MIKVSSISLCLVAWCVMSYGAARPNILFIAIDDLRPELGCYGGPQVKTPHLDELASQGVQFNRAYCQVAVCGASRASLMTGILPTANRFKSYLTRADEDVPKASTLPEAFKRAGYTTLSNGKIFHHRDDSEAESWSEPAWRSAGGTMVSYDPATVEKRSSRNRGRIYEMPDVEDKAYADGLTAEKSIEDLRRLKKAGKPFFLACGFVRPHMPFYAPKKYWDLYERDAIAIADNRYRPADAPAALQGSGEFKSYHLADFKVNSDAWHRMMRHGYMASVSYVDKLVGDVLQELDNLGLADNTVVVIWGDHGWHLGEHNFWGKHNTMHLATRVPLIIRAPTKGRGVSESLVETSDLFPTLCTLAGIPIPETVQGRSFAGVLDDPGQDFREVVYTRYGSGDAVVTEQFTYTRYLGGKGEMLYDLAKDPQENVNVAGKPEYAETVSKMKEKLNMRQKEASQARGVAGAPSVQKAKKKNPAKKQAAQEVYDASIPKPTLAGVRYGEHERHILDFWKAASDKPTPLVFVIHGGGWVGGSKERMGRFVDAPALLQAGISVAAINYRLMRHSQGVVPPVKAPLHDAARALQFVRSKAAEWNIDKARIGAAGGSAGSCSSLWLAFHDDLADPKSEDPIARESTRLWCAGVMGAQTTLDPIQMREWIPNSRYGGHAFGKKDFSQFLADREAIMPWITAYSPYGLVSDGDPSVLIQYNRPPDMGREQKDPTHSANFGIGLQQRCAAVGVGCEVVYPGVSGAKYKTPTAYLIATLKEEKS